MSEVYSVRMRNVVKDAAKKLGISLKEGVYMQLAGRITRRLLKSGCAECGALMRQG